MQALWWVEDTEGGPAFLRIFPFLLGVTARAPAAVPGGSTGAMGMPGTMGVAAGEDHACQVSHSEARGLSAFKGCRLGTRLAVANAFHSLPLSTMQRRAPWVLRVEDPPGSFVWRTRHCTPVTPCFHLTMMQWRAWLHKHSSCSYSNFLNQRSAYMHSCTAFLLTSNTPDTASLLSFTVCA